MMKIILFVNFLLFKIHSNTALNRNNNYSSCQTNEKGNNFSEFLLVHSQEIYFLLHKIAQIKIVLDLVFYLFVDRIRICKITFDWNQLLIVISYNRWIISCFIHNFFFWFYRIVIIHHKHNAHESAEKNFQYWEIGKFRLVIKDTKIKSYQFFVQNLKITFYWPI